MPECQSSLLKPVCSKGYQYWSAKAEIKFYKGVGRDEENLSGFLDVLLQYSPYEYSERAKIKDVLLMAEFAGYIDTLGIDVVYSQASAYGKGAYISLFSDESCDSSDEIDFLYAGITNTFKLACDVFLLDEKRGNIFSSRSSKVTVFRNPSLSRAQYEALIKLMEISVFSNAKELVAAFQDA